MASLSNSHKLVSKYGPALLLQLRDPRNACLDTVLDYISRDALAGRFKDKMENSFHLLLGSNFSEGFILPVLKALIESCSEGLKAANVDGCLPLHLCLSQYHVVPEVVLMVLTAFPGAAGVKNKAGMIPLFLCVMRDDSSAEICKHLCKAYPDGPSTVNRTDSYPLHFAAKRQWPNLEILRILVRYVVCYCAVCGIWGEWRVERGYVE
jgi:hypothetical protein